MDKMPVASVRKFRAYVAAAAALASLPLAGCQMDFRKDKADEEWTDGIATFSQLRQRVIGPRCASCHGFAGGVTLETYAQVFANLARIERVALGANPTMPPDGPLSAAEANLLRAWILAGAPETPGEGPPEVLRPDFSSLHRLVLGRKCVGCHTRNGGSASWLPLESYEDVAGENAAIVVPFDPDTSLLFQTTAALAEPRMPPADSGVPGLTAPELAALREWIANGAVNDAQTRGRR